MAEGSAAHALENRRLKLKSELEDIEKQIYNMETNYLNDSSTNGNVLKGFEGFLATHKATSLKRARNFKTEDRLFSLSSSTSPAVEELEQERIANRHFDERAMAGRGHKSR